MMDEISHEYRAIVDAALGQIPVRIAKLASDLGLEILKSHLSPNISGMIEPSQSAAAGFKIKINKYDVDTRQRFTAAHEIAHFLLHREHINNGIVDNIMYRSSLSSAKEVEANQLAADLLMPKSRIDEDFKAFGSVKDESTVTAMARKYKVSKDAMKIRLGMNIYA